MELLDNLPPTLQNLNLVYNGVSKEVKEEIRKQLKHTLPGLNVRI